MANIRFWGHQSSVFYLQKGQFEKIKRVKVQCNMAEAVKIIQYFTLRLQSERKKTRFILFSVEQKNFTEQGQRKVCCFCFFLEATDPNPLVKLSKLLCLNSNLLFPTFGLFINLLMLILHTPPFSAVRCRSSCALCLCYC